MEHELNKAAKKYAKMSEAEKHKIKVVPMETVLALFQEWRDRSITWGVDDFESRAIWQSDLEQGDESWKNIYDETKFSHALVTMINDHDCNNGITWDTVDYYLEEYCKK